MRTRIGFGLILSLGLMAAFLVVLRSRNASTKVEPPQTEVQSAETPDSSLVVAETSQPVAPILNDSTESAIAPIAPAPLAATSINKLERLKEIRQNFVVLAAGDPTAALRAAKQIGDETERETALLTLVTEWKQGELRAPRARAQAIAALGLEAGLALELTGHPELATLWAAELTEGRGRFAVLRELAASTVDSDPATAFGLREQLPTQEQQKFVESLYAGWSSRDTEAALKWADQLTDPAEKEAALKAIRTAAPVGIGAALSLQDGFPVINNLVPGSPAALSGQIRPGDRIIALAQGDNSFVDARGIPLEKLVQLVRGAPSTLLQLQVVSADAPPNSLPRTVSLLRDQVKFKQ